MNSSKEQTPFQNLPPGVKGRLIPTEKKEVTGKFVLIDAEKYYQISNCDSMLPFFISVASDSNHWMYISSTGGLSAGRKNADCALFPYYTDDKISESAEITGSKTCLQVIKNEQLYLWEPFSERAQGAYNIERTIAKSTIGNKLIFTEKNLDLGLTFSYKWMNADTYGWIKKSELKNDSTQAVEVRILDGLQNILPSGIDKATQNTYSTLVDGYKKTELIDNSSLALFRMEAILVDRAEPSESLRVNTVWSHGLENATYLLSSTQLKAFRNGDELVSETEAKGVRGAYFACTTIRLAGNASKSWYFVAEVDQHVAGVIDLLHFIKTKKDIATALETDVEIGTKNLKLIVAQADGVQSTADENGMARHFSNVLFNTMRGGIYSNNYQIATSDFVKHVKRFNIAVHSKHNDFLANLPEEMSYLQLEALVKAQSDIQLYRLFLEYLPLTFSRRHGDPSRPWNAFNINIKDENGEKLLSYQGNWRDIFQNWEALSFSYPLYINGIIAKFLNATTADGYNPYKITNNGIDWEVIEPENPWSNIGYWGDHQIIYLLKLMELSQNHFPEELTSWLDKEMFAHANVPYRLKSYSEIVANPKDSIRFDAELHHAIETLEKSYGSDARLILNSASEVVTVNFTEKLLATLLAKISNFIPEAGIWLNTLRPEWNDANNALVGNGTSMVTLYYMRRFVSFLQQLFVKSNLEEVRVSDEMSTFFVAISAILEKNKGMLQTGFDNQQRKYMADALGTAGDMYRQKVYAGFTGNKQSITKANLTDFLHTTLQYLDQSIVANKRDDKLYHAYNLVKFKSNEVEIRYLYEMLEGQVAVLTSGVLSASEVVELLDALKASTLYRADQNSYILYPNKRLPSFLEKNNINKADVDNNPLLTQLVKSNDKRIVVADIDGGFHFNSTFNNAFFLREALLKLKAEGQFEVTDAHMDAIAEIYEQVFDHQSFTGRSGTFYKYEGLGCIYWHMVSKLLLAIAENISWAIDRNEDSALIQALKQHYQAVKAGIGAHKSPADYGSFPFDPYSHTPTMAGVQQPGMTGQVKEDIISRFYELGVFVVNGCIEIRPEGIRSAEFISEPNLPKSLSFTYCSIPFTYVIDGQKGIEMKFIDKPSEFSSNYQLTKEQSHDVFNRNSRISSIIVHLIA